MTREEHTKLIRDIRASLGDEAKVTEILTNLSDDYGTVLTAAETDKANAEKLVKDNEGLRDVNMRLFLKVGSPDTGGKSETVVEKSEMTFDKLFNEKGGLL